MGLMTQKDMAQQGSERINEFLDKSKEDSIQKEFDEDAMQMADRQAEYESNLWKTDPSKQEAGLVSPIDSVLEFTGVGSAMEATRAVSSLVEGDWLGAALGMVAALPAGKKAKASLESSTGYVKQKKKIDGFDFWQSANPKANDVVRVPDSVTADISERVKRSFDSSTAATITPAPGKFWSPVKRVAVESPTGLPAGKTGKGKDATPRFVTVTDTDVAQPSYKKELHSMLTKAGITTDPDFGNYIMMGKNPKEVSGKTFENLFITPIGVTRNTTPIGARSPQPLARANPYSGEDMTIEQMRNNHKLNTGTTGTTYNTNLLQPKKFDIKTKSGLFDLDHPIVAVVDSNKHLYSLSTQFVGPATMVRKSVFGLAKGQYKVPQPNLRPATVGSASTGKQIGVIRIKSSGKEHPLYDYIEVDATASAPKDMGKIPKFNRGGLVDNEMQALSFNLGGDVTEQLPEGYTLEGGIPKAPTPETRPVEAIEFGGDGPESLYEASKATGIPWKDLIKFNGGVTQLPANGILNIPADYAQTKVQNKPMPVVKKEVSPLVSGLADKVQSFKEWMEDKVSRPDSVRQETTATNTEVVAQTDAALKEADVAPPNMAESNIVDSIHTEIRQQENGVRAGWKEETGKWLPHPSAEGGLPTIGYGHKFATQEEADAMIASGGITEEQALTLFQEDMNVSESRAKKAYEDNYKDRKWDSLDALGKLMLTEIAFNTGTLLENGVYNWPTLTKAIHDKDYGVASSQLNRTYTRKSDGKQVSLRGRTNALKAVYKTLLKDAGWTKDNSQASVDKTDYKNMIT